MLRDIVSGTGSLDSDAVTEALLCYANTKCRVLNKSPAEMAFGRSLKDFFPRQVSSLLPIPANLLSGPVKDVLQEKIREAGDKKWSEHTKVLPPLNVGEWVQLQNLKGSHPLKSDYSGEIVGRHNVNSYAVKVNGTGKVTVRNRASLRKIPPPVSIHAPMTVPNVSRPASGPRSGLAVGSQQGAVPAVPSMVTRSSLKASNVPRQNSMMQGLDEGPSQASNVPRQNSMKPASQAFHDQTCEKLMQQVANWDYPGNILAVLRKPSALGTHVADSGGSNARAESGQSVSVRDQPAGAGGVLGRQDRLDIRSVSQSDKSVVQVNGQLREPSPQQSNGVPLGPSPHLEQPIEVGLPEVRRSSRQRSHISPYQAGTGGMEGKSDKSS